MPPVSPNASHPSASRERVWRLASFCRTRRRFFSSAPLWDVFSCATRHAVLKSSVCGVDRLHPVKSQFPLSEFAIGESASAVESKNFDRTNHPNRTRTTRTARVGMSREVCHRQNFGVRHCASRDHAWRVPAPARGDHAPWARRAARASPGRRRRPGWLAPPLRVRRTPPRWRARRRNAP